MALERISDIILLIFVSISMPIYVVFILTVLINRKREPFQSPFFTLSVSLGVADILMAFHSYIFVRSVSWGWFESVWLTYGSSGSLLAIWSKAMIFGMAANQYFGVLLMSLNRFTAVVFSTKHNRIWSTRNTAIAIALQWIVPVILVAPMFLSKFEYSYYAMKDAETNYTLGVIFCDQNYKIAYYISGFILNLLVTAATCIMYIAVFIGAVRHSKRFAIVSNQLATSRAANSNEHSRVDARHKPSVFMRQHSRLSQISVLSVGWQATHSREFRLALSGFLVFISMFMYFLFLVLVLITGDPNFDDGVMYRITCDIFSCISPYALLLLSKQTRIAFMRTLQCKKSSL